MSNTVIELENVSKYYRLGTIGGKTINDDLQLLWAKLRGKENPLLEIGQKDHGNREGEFIWALRDINLKVDQGEILGIIGSNGAGKSTLLKILSRITGPTSGKVKIKGRIGSLLEVGTGFHPELTGRENVYLNGAILGMRRYEIDKKFDEIVDFSGVEKYIDTPVKRYSSGMRVRLGFAVAAHLDPEILIVDEVLAVGDAEFQKKCLNKMSDVAGEGRTVLFVSHNMGAIQQLTKRCILLNNSTIVFDNSPMFTIEEYLKLSEKNIDDFFQTKDDAILINYFGLENSSTQIIYNSPINLLFDFEPKNIIDKIRISIHVANSLNVNILASWIDYTISEPDQNNHYKLILSILNHNLPPGNYFLSLILNLANNDVLRYTNCLKLNISDQGNIDINLSKRGDKIGTFVPLLVKRGDNV